MTVDRAGRCRQQHWSVVSISDTPQIAHHKHQSPSNSLQSMECPRSEAGIHNGSCHSFESPDRQEPERRSHRSPGTPPPLQQIAVSLSATCRAFANGVTRAHLRHCPASHTPASTTLSTAQKVVGPLTATCTHLLFSQVGELWQSRGVHCPFVVHRGSASKTQKYKTRSRHVRHAPSVLCGRAAHSPHWPALHCPLLPKAE